MKKYYIIGTLVTFVIIFNLGYLFHDVLMGDWLHVKESQIIRESFIVPVIGIAFLLYSLILAFLFPIFNFYSIHHYKSWGIYKTAIVFGALIGFLWDALQGGIIEFATFKMPFVVVIVDSSYHIFEGIVATSILAYFYSRYYPIEKLNSNNPNHL